MESYTMDSAPPPFPEANTPMQITVEGSSQPSTPSYIQNVGRKRKGANEYAAQYQDDFSNRTILQNGMHVNVLMCKYCSVMISARSDRLKEHLLSKRHIKQKGEQTLGPSDFPVNGSNRQRSIKRRIASSTFIPPAPSSSGSCEGFGAIRESNMGMGIARGELPNTFQAQPSTSSAFNNRAVMEGNGNEIHVEQGKVNQSDSRQQFSNPPTQPKRDNSYHLKWETHAKIFRDSFISFQANEHLTDVTLILGCNMIKCHKVVLSTCSDYFTGIFKRHPATHPITIVLSPNVFSQVKALVHFMYHGEVTVPKEELKPLLKTAGELGIWGLTPRPLPQPPSEVETITEFGNMQGGIVDMAKVKQKESPNLQLSRPAAFPQGGASDCIALIKTKEGSSPNLPAQTQTGSSNGEMKLNACSNFDKLELHGVNGKDPFITGTSSMSVSQTPPWNRSPREGSATLVNNGALMTTGTGLETPRLPRKRKFQPEASVMSGMLEQRHSVPAMPDLISLKNNHLLHKFGDQMQAMTEFALTPDTNKGHGIGILPSYVNESIDRLHIAQEQYYSFGRNEQRERYFNSNDASCSSSHDIDAVTDGGSGQECNVDGVISDGSDDTAGDFTSRWRHCFQ